MFFTLNVDKKSGAKIRFFFILRYNNVLKGEKKIRIAMAVANDLVTDRRVDRHCRTLTEAGYDVVLIGRELPESIPVERSYPTVRMTLRHRRGWRFYAEYNLRLAMMLRRMAFDVVWANDLDTLPGCWITACRKRSPLVLDCHEIFPEVPEIRHKSLVKAVWRTVEKLMPRCDALLTVCNSLADYYHTKYGVKMTVVRNISDELAVAPRRSSLITDYSSLHLLLYQGAVNVGRGVDWAIDALEWLPECRLVVAGGGDLLEEMKAYAASKPWTNRIQFLGQVPPSELISLTGAADVGLVMLEEMGLNYHFALPNRIGDFVAAGVPMVVSDMPEMTAVVKRYGVGEVIDRLHGTDGRAKAKALAEAVERVLLREWSDADFIEARKDMDWNKEKEKLLKIIELI